MPNYLALWSVDTAYVRWVDVPQEIIDRGEEAIWDYIEDEGYDSSADEQTYCEDLLIDVTPEDNVQICPSCGQSCNNDVTIEDHGMCRDCLADRQWGAQEDDDD
jgi:hypothetical protein